MTTIIRRAAAGSPKLSAKLVVHWAERMLKVLSREDAELSVLLTNDRGIQRLNRDYRDKDRPTDVLSFHFDSTGLPAGIEGEWLLGDIVLSLDTAQRQAEGRHRPLEEEVRWLLAHGLLHLVGYDHTTAEQKRIMVAMTRKLVRAAGDVPPELAKEAPAKPAKPHSRKHVSATSKALPHSKPPSVVKHPPVTHPLPVKPPAASPRRTDKKPGMKSPRSSSSQKKTRRG